MLQIWQKNCGPLLQRGGGGGGPSGRQVFFIASITRFHLGRAALYPSFSRLDLPSGLKNAGFKVGLVLTKGSAGGAMIINPIS